MRIALLHPTLGITGGAERLTLDLAEQLATAGHSVQLFTGCYDAMKWGIPDSRRARIRVLDAGVDFMDPGSLADWRAVGAALAAELPSFDVVVAGLFPSNIWWLEALRCNPDLAGMPSVWYCHGFVGWDYAAVAERTLARLRGLQETVAPTERETRPGLALRLLRERGPQWFVRKILRTLRDSDKAGFVDARQALNVAAASSFSRVLGNSEFTSDNVRQAFGVESFTCHPGIDVAATREATREDRAVRDRSMLLSVARLDDSKNILGVLEAMSLLRESGRGLKLEYHVVGVGPELGRLRRFVLTRGLQGSVHFHGELSGVALERLYRTAGLFVLPCVDEGFGLVFLEAAAWALPVLGPDQGGPTDFIEPGVTGLAVDPLDTDAIAAAIEQATTGATDLDTLARAMLARLMDEYTVEDLAERFLIHLAAALESSGAADTEARR